MGTYMLHTDFEKIKRFQLKCFSLRCCANTSLRVVCDYMANRCVVGVAFYR